MKPDEKAPCGNTCRWCSFDGWVGPCCGECGSDCPSPVYDRKRHIFLPKKDEIARVFDALAFRAMSAKEVVEHVHLKLMGPVEDDKKGWDPKRPHTPNRERVEKFVASLCLQYGGKLGGLSQKKLVSEVMRKVESRSYKRVRASYHGLNGSQ